MIFDVQTQNGVVQSQDADRRAQSDSPKYFGDSFSHIHNDLGGWLEN